MFALDTNSIIHTLKGMGRVGKHLAQMHPSDLAVPAIVAYELEAGTLKSRNPKDRRRELYRLISVLTVLPFDQRAADHAARLRFELEKQGRQIGPLDTLIAGTVLASGATLVTHNVKEFSRVAGLLLEDWF